MLFDTTTPPSPGSTLPDGSTVPTSQALCPDPPADPGTSGSSGGFLQDIINALHSITGFITHLRSPDAAIDGFFHSIADKLGAAPGACGEAGSFQSIVQVGISGNTDTSSTTTGAFLTGFDAHSIYTMAWNVSADAALVTAGAAALWVIGKAAFTDPDKASAVVWRTVMQVALVGVFVGGGVAKSLMFFLTDLSGKAGSAAFTQFLDWNMILGVITFMLKALVGSLLIGKVAALAHIPLLSSVLKLVFVFFIANFLWLLMLIVLRFLIVGFCFGTAPLILPIALVCGGNNHVVTWWRNLFLGSLLAPVVAGFGLGLTLFMANAVESSYHHGAVLSFLTALLILVAGTWFVHQSIQALTFSHFGHHGNSTVAFAASMFGGAAGYALNRGLGGRGQQQEDLPGEFTTKKGPLGRAVDGMSQSQSPLLRMLSNAMTTGNASEMRLRGAVYDTVGHGVTTSSAGLRGALAALHGTGGLELSTGDRLDAARVGFSAAADARREEVHLAGLAESAPMPERSRARTEQWMTQSPQGQMLLAKATVGTVLEGASRSEQAAAVMTQPPFRQVRDSLEEWVGVASMGHPNQVVPSAAKWRLAEDRMATLDYLIDDARAAAPKTSSGVRPNVAPRRGPRPIARP